MSDPTVTTITSEHVDVRSSKSFEKTVKDLTAELGAASTEKLMDRLSASDSWDEYAEECADFAGRSNLIEVAFLNWGKVLTLSGSAMRAKCFVVGNPLTAAKVTEINYKDTALLRKFISDRGKIRARRVTGVSTQEQRLIATAVKNAREMALLPYSSSAR